MANEKKETKKAADAKSAANTDNAAEAKKPSLDKQILDAEKVLADLKAEKRIPSIGATNHLIEI